MLDRKTYCTQCNTETAHGCSALHIRKAINQLACIAGQRRAVHFPHKVHTCTCACITGNQHSNQHPSNKHGVTARVTKLQRVTCCLFRPFKDTATPYCAAPSSVMNDNRCLISRLSGVFLAFNVVDCSIHTIGGIVNAAHTITPGVLQPIITGADHTSMVTRTP